MSKRDTKRLNIIKNITYALKNIWKWDKAFYFIFVPVIIMNIAFPIAAVYFPKVIIDAIENKKSIYQIIAIIASYFAVLLLLQIFILLFN